jgi:hypothetical protein
MRYSQRQDPSRRVRPKVKRDEEPDPVLTEARGAPNPIVADH